MLLIFVFGFVFVSLSFSFLISFFFFFGFDYFACLPETHRNPPPPLSTSHLFLIDHFLIIFWVTKIIPKIILCPKKTICSKFEKNTKTKKRTPPKKKPEKNLITTLHYYVLLLNAAPPNTKHEMEITPFSSIVSKNVSFFFKMVFIIIIFFDLHSFHFIIVLSIRSEVSCYKSHAILSFIIISQQQNHFVPGCTFERDP